MKKALLGIFTTITIAAPVVAVVSCSNRNETIKIGKITTITYDVVGKINEIRLDGTSFLKRDNNNVINGLDIQSIFKDFKEDVSSYEPKNKTKHNKLIKDLKYLASRKDKPEGYFNVKSIITKIGNQLLFQTNTDPNSVGENIIVNNVRISHVGTVINDKTKAGSSTRTASTINGQIISIINHMKEM